MNVANAVFVNNEHHINFFIPCLTMIVLKRNGWKKYENRTPSFPEGVLSLEREERRLT
jgi:dolichol kinase